MATSDTVDFTAALISQTARAFGVALKCQVVLTDILSRNKSSMDKLVAVEEEMKKIKADADVEKVKAKQSEDAAKLESTLSQIKALKKVAYESQYEVVTLTKKVETSNNHQKLTSETLEQANLQL